ncbi:MAG TPA: heterodisulfide reductase-related iron-sulfur binding cluster [Gemmatimonadaceae bacterium]|nr:heterodisulfide reductase-related iron-sulfur binding cluster [Gemmatimonadaceae bacterium]
MSIRPGTALEPAESSTPCAVPGTPLADVRGGIDACVHCGFCLQACPTYTALDDENDSPRGRIVLMRSVFEGDLAPADPSVQEHIARCLGCRACETVCPSGVPYGQLLEATRATITPYRPAPLLARLGLRSFAFPRLLGALMAASRLLRMTGIPRLLARMPGRLGFANAMLAATASPVDAPSYTPSGDGSRGSVAVLTGCVMEGLFPDANRATERVLVENDYALVPAPGQRCCGALHAHSGSLDAARDLARRNVDAFERSGARYVVTNSAGCGAMMKEYGHLLANDAAYAERAARLAERVRDATQLLADAGPRPGAAVEARITYDAPCHLVHAQRLTTPPLVVLGAIPGLELVPLEDADRCCGAAGIYSLIEPGTSQAVLEPKLAHIAETGAELVATGNPGCLMQIGAGLRMTGASARAVHPIELLDLSYARAHQERRQVSE